MLVLFGLISAAASANEFCAAREFANYTGTVRTDFENCPYFIAAEGWRPGLSSMSKFNIIIQIVDFVTSFTESGHKIPYYTCLV